MDKLLEAIARYHTSDVVELIVPRLLAFRDHANLDDEHFAELLILVTQISGDVIKLCTNEEAK